MASALQRLRCVADGGANAMIGRATADIAVHGEIDVLITRLFDLLEQGNRTHHLTGLAIATLRHVARDPRFLHRRRFTAGDALHRLAPAVPGRRTRAVAPPQ